MAVSKTLKMEMTAKLNSASIIVTPKMKEMLVKATQHEKKIIKIQAVVRAMLVRKNKKFYQKFKNSARKVKN